MALDLTPVLSVVIHLIPMLLLVVRFRQLAEIVAAGPVVPALPAPSDAAYEAQNERIVSVAITREGFIVGGVGPDTPALPCRGGCTVDTYDYAALTDAMITAQRLHPTENRVVIAPAPDVAYEVVVRVMDATRSHMTGAVETPLFPNAVLAAPATAGAPAPPPTGSP